MPHVVFNAAKRRLTIQLHGLTEGEARDAFRALGSLLGQFGERRLACLGTQITAAVADPLGPEDGNGHAAGGCVFCDIAKKHGTCKPDGTACVF